MDKDVSKGIGTIIISVVAGIALQILVVKGMITQANANYWLIGAIILLFLGVYLVIRGTVLKSKSTPSVSSTENRPSVAEDATRAQDDHYRVLWANRIIRFIFTGVGLGLIVWGVIDSGNYLAFLGGFLVIIYGHMYFS